MVTMCTRVVFGGDSRWSQGKRLGGEDGVKMLHVLGDKCIVASSGNGAGEDVSDGGFISRKRRGVTAREFSVINAFACTVADNLLNVGSRVSCSTDLVEKGKP